MDSAVDKLNSISPEHSANSVLFYTFDIGKVIEHPSIEVLFSRLRDNGKAPASTFADFKALLLEGYARKYAPQSMFHEIHFNIKSNILYVNGEVDFDDYIYYELELPYKWQGAAPAEREFMQPYCEVALSVRVLVVNGFLRLQVGRFDKDYSPRILSPGLVAVYETFVTVTSFPLIYFSYQHGMPVRYLNLVAAALPSYKESFVEGGGQRGRDAMAADWESLNDDVAAYYILCDRDNRDSNFEEVKTLSRSFEEKRRPLLAAEGYVNEDEDEDEDDERWRYPDLGYSYWNEYGRVFFRNMNANRGSGLGDMRFADYYEEKW